MQRKYGRHAADTRGAVRHHRRSTRALTPATPQPAHLSGLTKSYKRHGRTVRDRSVEDHTLTSTVPFVGANISEKIIFGIIAHPISILLLVGASSADRSKSVHK
jgi:hypothetical protein